MSLAPALPNLHMQPTGRRGPRLLMGAVLPVAKQRRRQLRGREPEGLQLMRISLGRSSNSGLNRGT
jgi:hypothetical protein